MPRTLLASALILTFLLFALFRPAVTLPASSQATQEAVSAHFFGSLTGSATTDPSAADALFASFVGAAEGSGRSVAVRCDVAARTSFYREAVMLRRTNML